jgi:Fe2+ transport system protein FeoA
VSVRTLLELKPGELGHISKIEGPHPFVRRLVSLGITPGARIHFVRKAPLGDPLQLAVAGCHISIRAREAHNIQISE